MRCSQCNTAKSDQLPVRDSRVRGQKLQRGLIAACATIALTAAACGSSSSHSIGDGVQLSGKSVPKHLVARRLDISPLTVVSPLVALSSTFQLSPSGPLRTATQVTLPLSEAAPTGDSVVVATEETTTGPWSFLPATLSANRRSVTFITTHFSIFSVLGYDASTLIDTFESDFIDVLDSGATGTVSQPVCTGGNQARSDGYSIASSDTDTVYWCFGTSGQTRVLDLVDNRRYPLEIAHPGLTVADGGRIDYGQLSSLSHFGSGSYSILAPGGEITYSADVPVGTRAGISTQMDGLGQSLYALQTGINTLLEILTKLGFGDGSTAVTVTNGALGDIGCADAIGHGPVPMLAACFSPKELLQDFGTKAVLLIPLVALGPIVAFFHSEFNALVDQFNGHDVYNVVITHAAPPAVAACSAPLLFQAAVAKEHFNPNDPSYATMGSQGNNPGAYGVQCDGAWAVAAVSRPNVGTTDGETYFESVNGIWVELGNGPGGAECDLTQAGIPQSVAIVLSGGVANDPITNCISTPGEVPTLLAPGGGSEPEPFYEPTTLGFSGDSTNFITDITWTAWTATTATGQGTWGYLSCNPNCAQGGSTPYPATLTLTDPVDGSFSRITEQTAGPYGFSQTYTYPSPWALGASGGTSP